MLEEPAQRAIERRDEAAGVADRIDGARGLLDGIEHAETGAQVESEAARVALHQHGAAVLPRIEQLGTESRLGEHGVHAGSAGGMSVISVIRALRAAAGPG